MGTEEQELEGLKDLDVDLDDEVVEFTDVKVPEEEHPVYGLKPSAGPWVVSLRIAIVGAVLAILVFALPEFRSFRLTNDLVLNAGYVFMPVPIFALIWGLFSISHTEHRKNWRSGLGAMLLAIFSVALFAYTATTDNVVQSGAVVGSDSDRTLEMTEEELEAWRVEKLLR
jgi:hypothetical protein